QRLHYGTHLILGNDNSTIHRPRLVRKRARQRRDDDYGLRLRGSCETNGCNERRDDSEHVQLLRGYRSISSSEEEPLRSFVAVLAVALTAGAIALSADLFRLAGLSRYTEHYLPTPIALATPLVFLPAP